MGRVYGSHQTFAPSVIVPERRLHWCNNSAYLGETKVSLICHALSRYMHPPEQLLKPSESQAGVKNDPKQGFEAISSRCMHFLCDIFIFLFPGYTQHILKVWRKSISNFSKYSKINSVGSFLTPGWLLCVQKNSYHKYERSSNCLMDFQLQRQVQGKCYIFI